MQIVCKNPPIDRGIEVGQVFEGWRFVKILFHSEHFEFGNYTFKFERDGTRLSITNDAWPGDRAKCFNDSLMMRQDCPQELLPFTYRKLRIVQTQDRLAAQAED